MPHSTKKQKSKRTPLPSTTTMETRHTTAVGRAVSELLEDAGNCRPSIHQALNSHSLFSEQQKLRVVLDWAHTFLSSGSEDHHEIWSADNLKLSDKKQSETEKTSLTYKQSSSAKHYHPNSCTTGGNEVSEGRVTVEKFRQLDPSKAFPKNKSSEEYEHAQSDGKLSRKPKETAKQVKEMKVEKNVEDGTMEENGVKMCEESSSAFVMYTNDNLSQSQPQKILKQMADTSNANTTCQLKVLSNLTIYEQYQLYVDQLHHLKLRQSRDTEPGCTTESPEEERKTSEKPAAPDEAPHLPPSPFKFNSSSTNPEITKCPNKMQIRWWTTAEMTEERAKNQDGAAYKKNGASLNEHNESEQCDSLSAKEEAAATSANRPFCEKNSFTNTRPLNLYSDKRVGFMKRTEAVTSNDNVINPHLEHLSADAEERAALTPDPGVKGHQVDDRGDRGQKKRPGGQDQWMLCEKSMKLPWQQIKTQSADAAKHTQRAKHKSQYRDAHTCLQPTKGHTRSHDDPRPTSPAWGTKVNADANTTDCKSSPTGVPSCDWLCLPDEVWLSILSLLPHRNLCTVVQVCSRLQTLATDYTLWKCLKIENSTLTQRWLLTVGKRHPHSLCLYSCSSLSITSCGLEMFFTLCRDTLEEISVTSCAGLGLHGDQILPLVGKLCYHVTSVDVSWSGTTDTGVKALSYSCTGLRLKSVALNGCHVTDAPLKNLVMKHRESLCRLEVFGCQFLTSSCLQTVYEMCPGLQHLNIGQVPKVNTQSLSVMTSQLKRLISLNLTGLKAVTDATLETLLQNCVELQSLTLSSCPGVTDLTLHHISKYTPYIRSLDVSGCKTITDLGVQSLTLGCRRLQQLDLSSTGTGNRGVALLANYCSIRLRTVKLSFCHISLENILKLCRYCKRLNVLHLYGCVQLPTEREVREVNTTVKVLPRP